MAAEHPNGHWNSSDGFVDDYRPTKGHVVGHLGSRDDSTNGFNPSIHDGVPSTPPLLSSPSAASSIGAPSSVVSPLRRELSRSTLLDERDSVSSSSSKLALARRLSHLAQQLTSDDEVDELALTSQVDEMEKSMAQMSPARPRSVGARNSNGLESSVLSSPSSALLRSYLSDMPSPFMRREAKPEPDALQEVLKTRISMRQANKIIAEATKLNEELSVVVANFQARQEESEHIHDLLVERAERAAQRIIFLQSRIAYLEQELRENDDELQHLRICLKAVEVQMPPHPDPDIQRCIATFKEDYQALKKKRASRNSYASCYDPESTEVDVTASPSR